MRLGKVRLGDSPVIAVSVSDRESEKIIRSMQLDLIEVRVDRFRNLAPVYVNRKIKKIGAAGAAMILTVRSVDEGGEKRISDGEKLNIVRDNISLVDAIDIELRSPIIAEVMKVTKKNKKKTIVSWHDLKFTPSDKKLTGILYRAKKTGADLIKIAARANSMEDLNRLMKFTVKNRSKNIVVISLGSLGSISRVIFPGLGSLITYSYVSRPSGSGQIPLKELRKYLRMSHPSKNVKPLH